MEPFVSTQPGVEFSSRQFLLDGVRDQLNHAMPAGFVFGRAFVVPTTEETSRLTAKDAITHTCVLEPGMLTGCHSIAESQSCSLRRAK